MHPLEPRSIAVIGASADPSKLGHAVLQNLVTQGYKGKIFAVNPKGGEILGMTAAVSVKDIKESVDMAVVVTPAATVPAIAKECGEKKVQTFVVISAGFGELGTDEAHAREAELKKICEESSMHLIGPNCLGVLRPHIGMNASFAKDLPPSGPIALLTQSGALAVAIMDASPGLHLGYSSIVSMGNKAMMDAADFLEWCEDDKATKIIGMYVEDVKDGERLREVVTRIAPKKPIILLKSGVSERGKKAVSSHTGALAGSDAAIDALCAQTGMRRARGFDEFLTFLRILSTQPQLVTPRIAVITNAGGPGILATDAADREGLVLSDLEKKTITSLQKSLPPAASPKNPVDVLGDATEDRYKAALIACAEDENVDGIVVVLTPQVMTPVEKVAQAIIDVQKKFPLIPFIASFLGGESIAKGVELLHKNGVQNFPSPSTAIRALAALRPLNPEPWSSPYEKNEKRAQAAQELLKDKEGYIDEITSQNLFALYDLGIPEQGIAKNADEAVTIADEIGYPVIAKISSPDLPHKTESGGVKARLQNADEVRAAYKEILASVKKAAPQANINGVLIQKFLPVGHEMIVGGIRDATFGPLIMVGLGGIYTELMRDNAFGIAPIDEDDAYRMMLSLKAWKLLLGMRGAKQSDITGLVKLVMSVSDMMLECPQIQELDVNPVLVSDSGCILADLKVRIENKEKKIHGDDVPLLH